MDYCNLSSYDTALINDRLKNCKYPILRSAMARGYVCKGCSYAEDYTGRYGKGVKIHWANRETTNGSRTNWYHDISYVIFD